MNYASHNKEMRQESPLEDPVIFMKPDSSLLKDGKPFFLPDFSEDLHYEAEIVVKINRLGKNIAEQYANRYYKEVTVGIDFTARDLQTAFRAKALPWELSKGFDQSAVVGKFVPIQDIVDDLQSAPFHLDIDGKTVQKGHTSDMVFTIDQIIAYVSRFCTLKTGDLLFTGTPAGVGRVAIGNHLQGYLNGTKLLDFYVR